MRRMLQFSLVGLALVGCKDTDQDGTRDKRDCAPEDPTIGPEAIEICDGVDNNCNGQIDEDVAIVAYWDRDGAGFGDDEAVRRVCQMPSDGVTIGGDCDDLDARVHPDAGELCNAIDDDCDGVLDEDVTLTFYVDADGDGHGGVGTIDACFAPPGYAAVNDDCDDTDPRAWDDAPERCDGADNDCDGVVDEEVDLELRFVDADGDGFGDPDRPVRTCDPGLSAVDNAWDCDDDDPLRHPDQAEVVGNSVDEDCDGYLDELGVGGNGPFATVADALAVAAPGDVVQLDGGFHVGTVDLTLHPGVVLAGEGCQRTTLWGDGQGSVVTVASATVENLTVAGGTGTYLDGLTTFQGVDQLPGVYGGGILIQGDAVVRDVCVSASSVGGSGGGIAVVAGDVLVEDTVVHDNSADGAGGGLYVGPGTHVVGIRLQVLANRSTSTGGGGIEVEGGALELYASVVAGNEAIHKGIGLRAGPFYVEGPEANPVDPANPLTVYDYREGTALLDHVTFHANRFEPGATIRDTDARGAAVIARGGTITVRDSLFTGHPDMASVLSDSSYPYEEQWNLETGNPGSGLLVLDGVGFFGNTGRDLDADAGNEADEQISGPFVHGRVSGDPLYVSADPADRPTDWDLRLQARSPFRDRSADSARLDPDGTAGDLGAWGGPFARGGWAAYAEDGDGDGLVDAYEISRGLDLYGDDGGNDDDGDGLNNLAEQIRDTDPHLADTDGDGVPDGADDAPLDRWSHAPVAVAPYRAWGLVGEPIPLDATRSADPQGTPVTARWSIVEQPVTSTLAAVDLPDASLSSITPDAAGEYVVRLTVGDGQGESSVDVVVTALRAVIVPDDAPTIQEAIDASSAATGVAVRPGRWAGPLVVGDEPLTLIGLGEPGEVVIDAVGLGSTFTLGENADVTLARVTVTGGVSTSGGGILCDGADELRLFEVHVRSNRAVDGVGGGLACSNAEVLVEDSLFEDNRAPIGGGVHLSGGSLLSHLTVRRTVFANNRADLGGGYAQLPFYALYTRMDSVVFVGNEAADGAAIYSAPRPISGYFHPILDLFNVGFVANGLARPEDLNASAVRLASGQITAVGTVTWFNQAPGFVFSGAGARELNTHALLRGQDVGAFYDVSLTDEDTPTGSVGDARWIDMYGTSLEGFGSRDPSVVSDRGLAEFVDVDGSPQDLGPCGGPYAPRTCPLARIDTDGDGMNDLAEGVWGFDPGRDDAGDDADGDGSSNGAENASWGSPLQVDTDRDGRSDAFEYALDEQDGFDDRVVAIAGYGTAPPGARLTLDGSATFSADCLDRYDSCLLLYPIKTEEDCADELGACSVFDWDWQLLSAPPGSALTTADLVGASTATPSLVPDLAGQYVLGLTVTHPTTGAVDHDIALAAASRVVRVPEDLPTLDQALAAAIDGDIIQLGSGTFPVNPTTLTQRTITLQGAGVDVTTVLPASLGTLFTLDDEAVFELADLTIAGGRGGGVTNGGAVDCADSTFRANRVVFRDHLGERGGAIYADTCTLELDHADFFDNITRVGGGAVDTLESQLTWRGGRVTGNAGYNVDESSGALFVNGGDTVVENLAMADNAVPLSSNGAGAILVRGTGTFSARYLTIARNRGWRGAIVRRSDGMVVDVDYAIIVDTFGTNLSCALRNDFASVEFRAHHVLMNGNACTASPSSLVDAATAIYDDPRFVHYDPEDLTARDLHLRNDSPARDVAPGSYAPETDPDGSPADLGAYGGAGAPADFDPWGVDVDGDGMSDLWEGLVGLVVGTDDSAGDLDGDGLTNLEEYELATDASLADTDADGVADADEVSAGDDPRDPADHAPAVDAGFDRSDLPQLVPVDLTGSASDPDGGAVSVRWSFVEVPGTSAVTDASLVDRTTLAASFVPDHGGRYVLELRADDGDAVAIDQVSIRVQGDLLVPEDYADVGEAVSALCTGYDVLIGEGTFPANLVIRDKDVDLVGAGRDLTFLDGGFVGSVVDAAGVTQLGLFDLTLQNGMAGEGGGLRVQHETTVTTMVNVDVRDNLAVWGGGVFVSSFSHVDAYESRLVGNGASDEGGGISIRGSGTADFQRVVVADNLAIDFGGGLRVSTGFLSWNTGLCVDNASNYGGCMRADGNQSVIDIDLHQVTAVHNAATKHGTFASTGSWGDIRFRNCVIAEGDGPSVLNGSTANADPYAGSSHSLITDADENWTASVNVQPVLGMTYQADPPVFVASTDDLDWTNDDFHPLDPLDPLFVDRGVWIDGYESDGSDPDLGAFGGPLGETWIP